MDNNCWKHNVDGKLCFNVESGGVVLIGNEGQEKFVSRFKFILGHFK
jgi:hypothetical protein